MDWVRLLKVYKLTALVCGLFTALELALVPGLNNFHLKLQG